MTPSHLLAGVLVSALALSGCGPATQTPPPPRASVTSYVALGDTFASAPLIGTTAKAKGCRRGEDSYPHRVAALLDVKDFTDVTCDGATSDDIRTRQKTSSGRSAPRQIDAVSKDTQLVTLTIGAYDGTVFSAIAKACGEGGAGCLMANYQPALEKILAPVRSAVARDIRAVNAKAPSATVIVVGYPRHVESRVPKGQKKTCKGFPKLRPIDRRAWNELDESLNLALARAARDTGSEYVDVFGASQSHALCSDEPWILGSRPAKAVGIPFGPSAAGQEATARLVRDVVRSLD